MTKVFYRSGKFFKINESVLKKEARTPQILNALYAEVYEEFKGAVDSKQYGSLNPKERFDKLNEHAYNWLKERRLI